MKYKDAGIHRSIPRNKIRVRGDGYKHKDTMDKERKCSDKDKYINTPGEQETG